MIRAKIGIDEINYENLVLKLIPAKWLHPIAKVGLHFLKAKDTMAVQLFSKYREILIDKINTYCDTEQLPLHIRDAELIQSVKGRKNHLVLTFVLDEINYKEAVERIVPVITAKLSESEGKPGEVVRYLAGMGTTPRIMAEAALDAVSQRTRDEMVIVFMNIYQQEIVHMINQVLAKNDITSEISSLYMEVLP